MLKSINLKKLTAKTLIGILVAGSLVSQSSNNKVLADNASSSIIPALWGIDEDDGQLFKMTDYTDRDSMVDYGLLKWNDNGTIRTIGQDMEAMTLDEDGTMYIALDSRRLTSGGKGATLLKFNIQDVTTTGNNVVEIVGNIGINFDSWKDNISGLSIDPITGELVAVLKNYDDDDDNIVDKLYVISKIDGSLVREIGDIEGLGERSRSSEDIEHAPDGSLYVTDNGDDETYKVNTLTGAIIEVVDYNQENGLGSSSVKFEALGWDFANNRLIGFDDNDESLAKLTLEDGNNYEYYDTSSIGLTDVEGIDFVPTPDGEPLDDPTNPPPVPDPTPDDSDVDNNGILDDDELPGDIDGDGILNYLDLDDDGDNIADVMELHTPSAISNTGTSVMTHTLLDGSTLNVTLPNPPETNITDNEAIDTDGTGRPDYQDTDSDDDMISDADEAGDKNLETAPDDSDNYQSIGDNIPDFQDLDSDNNGILDISEENGDLDGDGKDNYKDLDDDGDKIPDVIEIGSNPASPINSDGNSQDGYDYQDTNSDDDLWLDVDEGIQASASGKTTTTVTVNYLAGTPFQFILRDWTQNNTENLDGNDKNDMTVTVTQESNGKVSITGTIIGLEYQIPTFGD